MILLRPCIIVCQCRKDIDLMRLQLRQCIGETVRLYIPVMQTGILADKIENEEKEKIEAALKDALEWLDDNQSAEKEDYEEKLKEVEAVCNPIISAVYQRSGGAPGGSDGGDEDDSHDEL